MNRRIIILGIIGIIFLLVVGITFSAHVSITWDELIQVKLAQVNLQYILHRSNELLTYQDRLYGITWELPLNAVSFVINKLLPFLPFFSIRHFIGYLLWCSGAIPLYWLSKSLIRTKVKAIPWIVVAFYLLSPRMFAHSFSNSKDIAFMVFFTWGMWSLEYWKLRRDLKAIIFAAIMVVLSTGIRILGILLILFFVIYVLQQLYEQRGVWKKNLLTQCIVFVSIIITGIFITTPYLWTSPVSHFIEILSVMKKFPWDENVLFLGNLIKAAHLPWYYSFAWIGLTTPTFYLIISVLGIVLYIIKIVREGFEKRFSLADPLHVVVLWVFLPLALAVISKATLYDEWRHLFFIYPAILLLAGYTLDFLTTNVSSKSVIVLYSVCTISIIVTMYQLLSLQYEPNMYFAPLLKPVVMNGNKPQFELDYWGWSCRNLLDQLPKGERIIVGSVTFPCEVNAQQFPEYNTIDILPVSQKPQYIVEVFRRQWYPVDSSCNRIYQKITNGIVIGNIYKCR